MKETVGRRVYAKADEIPCAEPGDYGKEGRHGVWYVIVPETGYSCGPISNHQVVEHEDGTITVTPSILCHHGVNGKPPWHGYLTRGVWKKVDE